MVNTLRLVPGAFACDPLSRTVTPTECAGLARTAIGMRGPKVDRPCLGCAIGEAHMRGETLALCDADESRSARNNRPHMVELDGHLVSLSRAAEMTGHDRRTIRSRMARGIPLDAPATRGPKASPRAVVTGQPSPANLIRQLRAAGYDAQPDVRDGRSVLLVTWPEGARSARQSTRSASEGSRTCAGPSEAGDAAQGREEAAE